MEETPPPLAVALCATKASGLLVSVPALKALRQALPEHRILAATSEGLSPIVRLIPGVDDHVTQWAPHAYLPLVPGEVDVAVNLQDAGPAGSVLHAVEPRILIEHGPRAQWRDDLHERERWVRLLTAFGICGDPDDVSLQTPTVCPPVPGAAVIDVGGRRAWPVEQWAQVASALAPPVVITGAPRDAVRAGVVADLAGLSRDAVLAGGGLMGLAALIAQARVVVCEHSAAAHLADAYGTPSVVLFDRDRWAWHPVHHGPHIALHRDLGSMTPTAVLTSLNELGVVTAA